MLWRKPHVAEMTAEVRALYDEPDAPPAAATFLLPDGETARGPWPYTEPELARVRAALPAPSADAATEKALFAVRWFLARNRLRERRNEPAKPDPHSELASIGVAVEELKAAIKAASPLATRHLFDHPSPGAASPPMRPGDLLHTLDRFSHDNRFAFRSLPESDAMGRPTKASEQRLILALHHTWEGAHERPETRGWPAFLSACVEPLARYRCLPPRSPRAWQNVLTAAKERHKGEVKSPF